jgi:hypothetical protein
MSLKLEPGKKSFISFVPDDGGYFGRGHEELRLAVRLRHDRGAVGVGQALHLAARVDHVINGHLKLRPQVAEKMTGINAAFKHPIWRQITPAFRATVSRLKL